MSLQDLWNRAHPNSAIRRKYLTAESLPGSPDKHDEDKRAERELGDRFQSDTLVSSQIQDWDDARDYRESTDQPKEVGDFLGQGGWHIEYTEKHHQGVAAELWPAALAAELSRGWLRADRLISQWARTDCERAFLQAVASGHSQGEARRLSGLNRPDHLIARIRAMGYKQAKDEE